MADLPSSLASDFGLTEMTCIGTTSSSPYSGSPTFDAAPFHLHGGHRPPLGTFVVIDRGAGDALHYGRIMSGQEENPRADPVMLQQNAAYRVGARDPRPGELAPHVTRVMTIELLGEIRRAETASGFATAEPALLAETGMGVHTVPGERLAELLGTPTDMADGICLGTVASGGTTIPFILPTEALARHVAVLGKTGVGKSWAVGVAVEELVRLEIPVVAFDVLGDLVNAASDLGGQSLTAGTEVRVPFSLVGFQEFLQFLSLTSAQEEIVDSAYDEIHAGAVKVMADPAHDLPTVRDLITAILEVGSDMGQPKVGERAAKRVEAALRRSRILSEQSDATLAAIGAHAITNIFLGTLTQRERNLVVGSAARLLQRFRRAGRIPPFVFVLDEAHLFLPAGGELTPSTAVLREMVRTARHDGIGIILISQSPASLDKQVLLTCNTRLVFALDRDDLRIVGGTMGDVPEAVLQRIPKLGKGTAIISSGADIMRHTSMVAISGTRRTREGAPTPNLAKDVKSWHDAHA